jgi:hypothetical protein
MTPFTVSEARAILRADEALDLTYETRVAAGTTFSDEEREAWMTLVAGAKDRIAAFDKKAVYTIKRLSDEDAAEISELLRVSLDDKHFLGWHPRLREIREKMIVQLGDVAEKQRST